MTREQRKEAIEGPLGRVEMAPNLVQRMLNDAGDEPDQLPVLQHALMRTWSHWRKADPDRTRRIELQDYEAIGELAGALNQHANELLAGVSTDTTATIFKRLTARGRGSRERRNPALLSELWAVCGAGTPDRQGAVNAIVDRFRRGEATFLTPRDGDVAGDTYIDITHECLIRQWRKLGDEWLPAEQKSAKTFLDLIDRARNWKDKKGEVLIGLDLSEALEWDRERNPTAAWARHYASEAALGVVEEFIAASEKQERDEVERRQRERRRLRLAIGAAVLAIVAGLVAGIWFQARAAMVAQKAALDASAAAFRARILSAPSVRDPLVRALLLVELKQYALPEHLAIYQDAATAAVPFAVFRFPDSTPVRRAGFLGDSKAAIALGNGTLWSWRSDGHGDGSTQKVVGAPDGDTAPSTLSAVAISRDGRWIAGATQGGAVWLGRTDHPAAPGAGSSTPNPSGADTVSALAFSDDGRQLAAAYNDFSVRIFRLDGLSDGVLHKHEISLKGAHTGPISSVAFDAAGARLLSGSWDGTTRVWNLDTRKQQLIARNEKEQVTCVAFSPDGTWALIGYNGGGIRVRKIDSTTPLDAAIPAHTAAITAATFSADGSRILTSSDDHTAKIWIVIASRSGRDDDTIVPKLVGSPIVLTHDASVSDAVFSADGSNIITASADGTARIWRSQQGEPRVLGVHDGRVESAMFSHDGTRVLTASDDRTARIWTIDGTSKPQVLAGHNEWVRSAAFDPVDDRKVVTASEDGTLRLWDLAQRKSSVLQERLTVLGAALIQAYSRGHGCRGQHRAHLVDEYTRSGRPASRHARPVRSYRASA